MSPLIFKGTKVTNRLQLKDAAFALQTLVGEDGNEHTLS